MRSIRYRLNMGLAFSLVVIFLLLGLGASLSIRVLTEAYISSRLEHDAESILNALVFSGDAIAPEIRAGRISAIFYRPFSGHYFRIHLDNDVIQSRSLWDQDLEVPEATLGETLRLRVKGPEGQLLLVRVSGYRKDGHDMSIAVAEDLTPIAADVRRFQIQFIAFSLLALVALLFIQRYVLRVGLAPISRTQEEIGDLAKGQRQSLSVDVPEEIQPLVTEINRLLDLMQQRLKRSRNSLGNLAHSLKTPLTMVAQLAKRKEFEQCGEIQESLHKQVDTLRHLMDRELKRARLAGTTTAASHLQLASEVKSLVDVLTAIYREKRLEYEIRIPGDLTLLADKEDLLELLGNLLDNACKWANDRVQITAESDQHTIRITIEDDGPGRTDEEMLNIQDRGVRVDESTVLGFGLGLAIAREIVEQYKGKMHLSHSQQLGGFCVELVFPRAGTG